MSRLVLGVLCLFVLFSCSVVKQREQQLNAFTCYADINTDSKCIKVDCDYANNHCSEFGDRMMLIYPLKEIYFYRINPLTKLDECKEFAEKGK